VLLVEQHAELALGLTQEAMVIDGGTVAFRGASQALLTDRAIWIVSSGCSSSEGSRYGR
jgi:ABC-type branched-subunit amino acid transport system ATPase component